MIALWSLHKNESNIFSPRVERGNEAFNGILLCFLFLSYYHYYYYFGIISMIQSAKKGTMELTEIFPEI